MKITDIAIIFILITLPFLLLFRIKSDNLQSVEFQSIVLNKYIDTAVEDASIAMVTRGENDKVTISRDKALDAFFDTLYTNFNLTDNDISQYTLQGYIPVVVLIDYDGFWIYSMETYKNSSHEEISEMIWKPKKSYAYEQDGYVFLFTLDDYVKVLNTVDNSFFEGKCETVRSSLPSNEILQDNILFEEVRKRTIVECIKNDVNAEINEHNKYARLFGITYNFCPPIISDDDWHNNIEDIGFLSFIQGIPIGTSGEKLNSYALGAARVVRKNHYYIQQDDNGLDYYHRELCPLVISKDEIFDSREECAIKGAFPCRMCKP
ncbi:MAG: hypothetical protein GX283_05910 [Clostridiaceae bacterium]|jgi:hypothetical protein|nr:hypothetical protein [Clostridiaceae bacterium]